MQDAGAAAIELNVYYVPGDITTAAREVEQRYLDILDDVKSRVGVPVAMKLSPYLSSFGKMAQALDAAGADGLVLFNRYLQPDIDVLAPISRHGLAIPMIVVGALLMLGCAPLMWRWFLASMRERSR